MKNNRNHKPNRKQPRVKGPIVVDIHDNPVNIKIRVGNIISGMSNQDIPHTLFPLDESNKSRLRDVKATYFKVCGEIDLSGLNIPSKQRKKRMSSSEGQHETKNVADFVTSKVITDDSSGSIPKIIGRIGKGLGFGAMIIGGVITINQWWKKRG